MPSCPSSPTRSCSNVLLNWVTKISFKNSEHSTGHTFPILFTPTTDLKILKANDQLQSTHSHASTIPSPPSEWFLTGLFKTGEKIREHIGAELPSSLSQQDHACAPCNATLQWLVASAHRFTCWQALQTTRNRERRRLTRFIGSGNLLLLSCSPRLLSYFPAAQFSSAGDFSPSKVHPAPGTPLQLLCLLPLPTDLLSVCGAVSTCFGQQLCHFSVHTHPSPSGTQKQKQPRRPHNTDTGGHSPHQLLSPLQSSLGFQFSNLKQKTKSYWTVRGSHTGPPLQWPCLQKISIWADESELWGKKEERKRSTNLLIVSFRDGCYCSKYYTKL